LWEGWKEGVTGTRWTTKGKDTAFMGETVFYISYRATTPPKPFGPTPVVVILARAHAGETPTSFVAQGLIDFLSSNHEVARELREFVLFKVVPMMNPDGAYLGNTRGNLLGQDLNRRWADPDPRVHPTVYAARQMIYAMDTSGGVRRDASGESQQQDGETLDQYVAEDGFELDTVVDLHAHSSLHGLFVYGNSYDDVYRFEVSQQVENNFTSLLTSK